MNANELMIGDWVLDGNVYAQVTSITCDGIIETTHNEHSNIELVEPIPLTPEILKKLGLSVRVAQATGTKATATLAYCIGVRTKKNLLSVVRVTTVWSR